ncbi:hypothetical protein VPNG_04038 [Cytospora leucostoma]|uniref:F-box domain-containing protein n=1 Tax=Cytospora leucostoma TaxID=1230097 RepID=A0A423XD00_9PEZI|nr:hypothetical protein VPNG_04038 [Cytospora leucostoma]
MPMETPAHKFTQAEEMLVHLAGHIQDHSTLWSLCLASRAFYRIFRDYLWASIVWNDRNDTFFSDKSRLANFLFTHKDDLSRAHSLRAVKKCISHDSFDQDEWLTVSDHYGFLDYLDGMKLLHSHMPNLKRFEWAGPCDYGTIQSLAQHCPRLERLYVCSTGDDRLSKLASRQTLKGASYKSLPCLTSAAYHQASLWGSFERRATVSDEASRYILDKAPALESMSFHWPKMRHIEDERRAVEDFIFFFIVTRAPEDLLCVGVRPRWKGLPQMCWAPNSGDDSSRWRRPPSYVSGEEGGRFIRMDITGMSQLDGLLSLE